MMNYVWKGLELGLNLAADASMVGVVDVLQKSPMVGIAFATLGYTLDAAEHYSKDRENLPKAQELVLELCKQCTANLVSHEMLALKTEEKDMLTAS